MPKQSDRDFANLVLKEGLATREQIEECLELLKTLKEEAGVEDSIDGILCLKGVINEAQANVIWQKIASGEVDDIVEEFPSAPLPEPDPRPKASSRFPAIPGTHFVAKLEKDSTGINYLSDMEGSRKEIVHILYPQTAGNERLLKWLVRHGQSLKKLDHPAIASFRPPQTFENRVYFGQAIPQGEQITALVEEGGAFDQERALAVFEQIVKVHFFVESNGFAHGWLTPRNVYLLQDGQVELRFFTSLEMELRLRAGRFNTEEKRFIAPEMAKPGSRSDVRADIYSTGMLLIYMIAGPDFATKGPQVGMDALSGGIGRIVEKMMAYDPKDRFESFGEVLRQFGRLLEADGEEEPPRPKKKKEKKKLRRKTGAVKARPVAEDEIVEVEPLPEVEPVRQARKRDPNDRKGRKKSVRGDSSPRRLGKRDSRKARPVEDPPEVLEEVEPLDDAAPKKKPLRLKKKSARSGKKGSRKARPVEEPPEVIEEVEPLALSPEPLKPPLKKKKKKPPPPPPEPEEEEEPEPDPRYGKKMEAARKRQEKGDWGGALAKLMEAAGYAPSRTEHGRLVTELRTQAYREITSDAESRDEENDLEGAVAAYERAKPFARDSADLDPIIENIRHRIEAEKRSTRLRKQEKKAQTRIDKGDVLGAMGILEKAMDLCDDPAVMEARIATLAREAFDEKLTKSRACEEAKDFKGALACLVEAEAFTSDEEGIEAIKEALGKRREEAERRAEYERCDAQALSEAEAGNVDGAISWWEKTKTFSTSPVSVQAKIDNLKTETYKDLMEQSHAAQTRGDFIGAVELCEKARDWAPHPEEVEAAIEVLQKKKEQAEKKETFTSLKTEADSLEKEGDLRAALEKMDEVEDVTETRVSARMKIDSLKKRIFDDAVNRGKDLEKKGRFKAAIQLYKDVKKYASQPKNIDLLVATAKRERTHKKKEKEFKRLEREAREKLKTLDYKGAIETMESAREFSDSAVTVEAKIEGLRKAAFDAITAEAKDLEEAGEWSEAIAAYERARPFADAPDKVDRIIETLQSESERIRTRATLDRLFCDADDLANRGDVKAAVKVLEEAKQYGDPVEIQARIDKMLVESMYKKCMELAEQKEQAGDIGGALAASEKARGFSESHPELEEYIRRLTALATGEEAGADAPPKVAPKTEALKSNGERKREMADLIASLPAVDPKNPKKSKYKTVEISAKKVTGASIKVTCNSCKKTFLVKKEYEGRKGRCPKCKSSVRIPIVSAKVVCFLCDKVMPESKAQKRGDEYYCSNCDEFIGGNEDD
jgi:tetratricopeptide (TPR) repeat protein